MKKIIIMGIPHHGNIGDNAIAVAEEELIKKFFPQYKVYIMQEKYLDVCVNKVKKVIKDEDIILLHGGGNIGDTYERPEKGRREVIKTDYKSGNVLEGTYESLFKGKSMEFDELREYVMGDEVNDIDWKASSRSRRLLVRQYIAEKKHNVLFVLDTNRRMLAASSAVTSST